MALDIRLGRVLFLLATVTVACGQENPAETSGIDCLSFALISGGTRGAPEAVESLNIARSEVDSVVVGRRELPDHIRELVSESGVEPLANRSFVEVQLRSRAAEELARATKSSVGDRIRVSRPDYPTIEPVIHSEIEDGLFRVEVDSQELAAQVERMFMEGCP